MLLEICSSLAISLGCILTGRCNHLQLLLLRASPPMVFILRCRIADTLGSEIRLSAEAGFCQ
jgi:hypothetical protein